MVYLILQILWFLVAAAAIGFAVGWLCRSLAIAHRRETAAMRARGLEGEALGQRERLEARLAEATSARKALEDEIAQLREAAREGGRSLRKLERDHSATRVRLEAREREVAPPAVRSPITPAPLGIMRDPSGPDMPGTPPQALAAPQGEADDLQRIAGIGPGIEKALREAGIHHYRQLAELTPQNLAWLDHALHLKGRAEREDWVGQARALLAGADLSELGSLVRQK